MTGPAKSPPACPIITAGTSGSFSSFTRKVWRIARKAKSTGARSVAPSWPTSRSWPMAAAGGTKILWSSSANSSNGSCASQNTLTSYCAISTSSKAGRKKSAPCSATGSAAAKARASISNSTTPNRITASAQPVRPSASSPRASTLFSAQLRSNSRPSIPWSTISPRTILICAPRSIS